MDQVLVSVVIPAYNCEKFIEETIRSVLNQTHRNLEVLVIDDGSTDGQGECILDLCKIDSRIKYTVQDNQGVSTARNKGFLQSKGDLIAFLDADDVWMSDNISSKIQKMEEGDYGLVHSDGYVINENSAPTGLIMQGCEGMLLDDILEWKSTQVPGPSSILLKRNVLETVGLFDPLLSTSADHDLFLRVAARFRIGRVSSPTWKYRIHGINMHKNIRRMEKDVLYVYQKASSNGYFRDGWFERLCFSNMYLILAASWAGDGRNKWRAMYFAGLALITHPAAVLNIWKRMTKRWALV